MGTIAGNPGHLDPIPSLTAGAHLQPCQRELQLLSMGMGVEGDRNAPVPSGGVTDDPDKAGHRTPNLQHPALVHATAKSVADGQGVCPRKQKSHIRQGVAPAFS